MKMAREVLEMDAEDLTLGLSCADFAELIVGGFDAWCAALQGSTVQQPVGGTWPHRWDALSGEDGAVAACQFNDSCLVGASVNRGLDPDVGDFDSLIRKEKTACYGPRTFVRADLGHFFRHQDNERLS